MITLNNIQEGAVKAARPLFTFSFLLFTLASNAQEIKLKSNIIGTDNQPVTGAIVTVAGGESVVSDKDGNVNINGKDAKTVVTIKADGYYDAEFPLSYFIKKDSRKESLTVTLIPKDEKSYTGYHTTSAAEKKNVTNSTSTTVGLESKDFGDQISIGSAIGNNIAGLQVIDKSGMPNEGSYINIRGVHTLNAESNPLIVINGIPYFGNMSVSDIINGYSRDILGAYDVKDIRSVTVLKGAEAAQWGSLGSNGVILIETQTANSENLNTKITFSGQYGISFAKKGIGMMDASQYKSYMQDIGMSRYGSMASLVSDYPFLQNSSSYTGSYLFSQDHNWSDEISRTGFSTDNVVRVEGGDEIAKYNISFGYTKNNGTLKNTSSDKYRTLISADVLVTRKLDIFANVGLSYITSELQNTGTLSAYNPITSAMWNSPMVSAYQQQFDSEHPNGSELPLYARYYETNTASNPAYAYDNVSNPLALVNTVEGKDKIYDVNAGLGLNFKWNEYLTLHGLANLYYNYTEENMFAPGVTYEAIIPQYYGTGQNYSASSVVRHMTNTYQGSADYKRTWNNVHNFSASLTARWIMNKLEYDGGSGYNTPNDFYTTLNNLKTNRQTFGSNYYWNMFGTSLQAEYNWKSIVRAYGGVTMDGTSASGDDAARWGFFPNAGATFFVANTGILPEWINKLNLTAEFSMTGNSRFSSSYGKNVYVDANFMSISGIARSNMPNLKLTWEKTRQMDFGLDLATLGNRLSFGFNYYLSNSYDLLFSGNLSSVYGSSVYYDNVGEVNNRGFEVSLRINPIHDKDWDFVVSATVAHNLSELKSLGANTQSGVISFTDYNNDDAQVLMKVGQNPYQFYGYKTAGVYATTEQAEKANLTNSTGQKYQAGDMIYVDQNGDGVIDSDDKVAIGCATPDIFGAVNLGLRFKRFRLDADFSYSIGNDAYNYTRRLAESMTNFYNQSTAVLNRWQVEGQITDVPRAVYGDAIGNSAFSDRWIEDASYLKLRSIKFSYDFGKIFGFINSGDIWVAAENLFTITRYLGADPEFSYGYTECMRGFDYAKVAHPRTFKIGFDLNF